MSRGLGAVRFAGDLPDAVVVLAGLVTQLGDAWFVLVGIAAVFAGHRTGLSLTDDPWRDCLFLLGLAVGSYSLTVVLKHVFALPRPPGATTATPPGWLPAVAGPAFEAMVTGDGYGFPSGHALKSTVVYGGWALTLTVWNRRRRFVAAGVTALLVALSRVFIGVHYVVDVVAGVLVGVAVLAVLVRTGERHPGRVLAVATGLGLAAFAASFSAESALAAAAGAVGLAAWTYAERSGLRATSDRSSPTVGSDDS